jgi:hypothetical protein
VLQKLPKVRNASRKTKLSANAPSFPSPAVQEEDPFLLQYGHPVEGRDDGLKFAYMFPGDDTVYEGINATVAEMRKGNRDGTGLFKGPKLIDIDKENEDQAKAKAD